MMLCSAVNVEWPFKQYCVLMCCMLMYGEGSSPDWRLLMSYNLLGYVRELLFLQFYCLLDLNCCECHVM